MANKTRTNQVMCRLNDEELEKYKILLNESGMKSQDFVRKAITTKRFTVIKKVTKESENNELGQALFQLSKLGTNINQIARALNEKGYVDYGHINKTLDSVKDLTEQIKKELATDDIGKYIL